MSKIEMAVEAAAKLRDDGKSPGYGRKDVEIATRTGSHVGQVSGAPKDICRNPSVITLHDPASPIAEEYRKLKGILLRLTKKDDFRNTVMVTSSSAGEGKSLTALNLAITFSQEYENSVLLVDADTRRPSLQTYLNVTQKAGLSDCLCGDIDIEGVLVKTGIPKLAFMPSGRSVSDPVELLSSFRMKELLGELKHRYPDRYIIIDAPPVLPFAETHSVAAIADGVVFVVKEGLATVNDISEALELLKGAKILGIVYNDANVGSLIGRYHYGRYNDYATYRKGG